MSDYQNFLDALSRGLGSRNPTHMVEQDTGALGQDAAPPANALNAEQAIERLGAIRGGLIKIFNSIQNRATRYSAPPLCSTRLEYMELVERYKILGRNVLDEIKKRRPDIKICQVVLDAAGNPTGQCRELDAPLLPPMYVVSDCPRPMSTAGALGAFGIGPVIAGLIRVIVIATGTIATIALLRNTWLLETKPEDVQRLEANLKRFEALEACVTRRLAEGAPPDKARALCMGDLPPIEPGLSGWAWFGIISAITVGSAVLGVVLYKALSPMERAERAAARARVEEAEREAEEAERAAEEARERAQLVRRRRGRLEPAMADFGRSRDWNRRSIYVLESVEE